MQKLYSVCWDITSKCNENCEFCFRDAESVDLSLQDNLLILEKLHNYGINKITFTGGEACLYENLWDLIKTAKAYGIKVHLVTNAKSINEDFYSNVDKYVDSITFPLDGADTSIQSKMTRNSSHFDNVTQALMILSETSYNVSLIINTVVSRININDIINIHSLLKHYRIKAWKLFRFTPLRFNAIINSEKFNITNKEFTEIQSKITHMSTNDDLKIVFQSSESICDSYFVISSNGNVLAGNPKEQKKIGNVIQNDIDDILSCFDFDFDEHILRNRI